MVKNSGFLGHISRFWRFFNFYWILVLQTAKIWLGMNILIFWHHWHPWGRVCSAWKENWLHLTQCLCLSTTFSRYVKLNIKISKILFSNHKLMIFSIPKKTLFFSNQYEIQYSLRPSKTLTHFSRFLRFFNFDWILALQTAKIWFGMNFLIFWYPWHPTMWKFSKSDAVLVSLRFLTFITWEFENLFFIS